VDIGAAVGGVVLDGLSIVEKITGNMAVQIAGQVMNILGNAVAIVGILEGAGEREVSECKVSTHPNH
jgi:hypothetical protein